LDILHWGLAVLPGLISAQMRTSSGSFAKFDAIRARGYFVCLDVQHATISAFKSIKVGQVPKSRRCLLMRKKATSPLVA
jgi:hypothetical protein